jgi:hypothetical protein
MEQTPHFKSHPGKEASREEILQWVENPFDQHK